MLMLTLLVIAVSLLLAYFVALCGDTMRLIRQIIALRWLSI